MWNRLISSHLIYVYLFAGTVAALYAFGYVLAQFYGAGAGYDVLSLEQDGPRSGVHLVSGGHPARRPLNNALRRTCKDISDRDTRAVFAAWAA